MRKLVLIAALAALGGCLVTLIALAIAGHTPKAGGLSQAVVGTPDALYILRGHQRDDPLYFWRCPITEAVCYDEPLTGLPGAETGARGVFQNGTALAWDGERYIYALTGRFYKQEGRNELWRYDLTDRKWDNLGQTTVDGQLKRQGPGDALAYVEHDGKAYLYAFFGAARGEDRADLNYNGFLRYDIEANKWEELPKPWDCTDDGAALAWDGGRYLYALHGSDCEDNPTQEFKLFDLAAQTPSWETMPSIPDPVDDGGSLVWNSGSYLYSITGGAYEHGSDGKGFYRFNLDQLQWESLERLPCPVGCWNGNRLGVLSGRIYLWQGSPSNWECGGNVILSYGGWDPTD